MKHCATWWAQIAVGLKPGYGQAEIFPPQAALNLVRHYCDEIGWGVTVTKTNFVYTGGIEPGVLVGITQYPRFPKPPAVLEEQVFELAKRLLIGLHQERLTVVFPDRTVMIERKDCE